MSEKKTNRDVVETTILGQNGNTTIHAILFGIDSSDDTIFYIDRNYQKHPLLGLTCSKSCKTRDIRWLDIICNMMNQLLYNHAELIDITPFESSELGYFTILN